MCLSSNHGADHTFVLGLLSIAYLELLEEPAAVLSHP